MNKHYQICTKCVMDTSDPRISFDEKGVCTHTRRFLKYQRSFEENKTYSKENFKKKIQQIKSSGINNKYDCIIGLSGGVDSSYMVYQACQFGLKPLCVHLDNGWNSETSVRNIEKIIKKLNLNLYTHVIDWEEFKDMQKAFLRSSVVDIESLTDHAIMAILYRIAFENNVKYIFSGWNFASENVMPYSWNYHKLDLLNILHIQHVYGTKKINTFPIIDQLRMEQYENESGIEQVYFLNYIQYYKSKAIQVLKDELGWKYYGEKHYESIFTKFYQAYILPTKFNIDKRKAHLSSLIHSEQITRDEALEELKQPLYLEDELRKDKQFVLKKLELSNSEFDDIINLPIKKHTDYFCSLTTRK